MSHDQIKQNQAADVEQSRKVTSRLKLYFAMLSCLGGLVLAAGTDSATVPAIAIFFAIFGYLFVDLLELFALPSVAAYAAMGIAAIFCVSDFTEMDSPGNHQMIAVAQLLVFVQAILMLQRKSQRIFEQLGVFCLLELVVAAVFNHAIFYGFLLIPIGIIGAWAMSLLAALSATDGLSVEPGLDQSDGPVSLFKKDQSESIITSTSPESVQSMTTVALRLPRVALMTLTPAVLMVAAIFFYGLPRTTDAARVRGSGNALVGFNDTITLEQIGQMSQSNEVALRVRMTKRSTGEHYRVAGGMYFRGRVLENYRRQIEAPTATWSASRLDTTNRSSELPIEYFSRRTTDDNFYDAVDVEVTCESIRSAALFAVAPFYSKNRNSNVFFLNNQWTISRADAETGWEYPRLTYSFGTHAFRRGVQTDVIARLPQFNKGDEGYDVIRDESYIDDILSYRESLVPTARRLSQQFVNGSNGKRKNDFDIAKSMEAFLNSGENYQYTLNLDKKPIPGMDPIEQFLLSDKVGHCQFLSTSLTLMLRSQNIPARVVVGYHTDEYNELTEKYIARQFHAHAWVEALIDADQLGKHRVVYGQPESDKYWVRLDPTPGIGRLREDASGVGSVLDMAQNVWDDYVVDMDARQQDESGLLIGRGSQPMSAQFDSMISWLALKINRLRAGELGGGSLAGRSLFSWQAALVTGFLAIVVALLIRLRAPSWLKRKIRGEGEERVDRPLIPFYAETLDQLARIDIHRKASQTPEELTRLATDKLQHPLIPSVADPLGYLTSVFYRLRFGSGDNGGLDLEMSSPIEHARQRSAEVDEALSAVKKSIDLMTTDTK